MLNCRLTTKATRVFFCGLLGICICVSSCTRHRTTPQDAAPASRAFRLPKIPATCTTPGQRAEYLVAHYWDHFDFRDTSLVSHPEITEQAFANFISILPYANDPGQGLCAVLDRASTDSAMFACFRDLAEKYLYDPNSPMRSEELYIPALEYIVLSPKVDSIEKLRPQYQLDMARKNRPGMIATDFTYTTESASGTPSRHRLHNLGSKYTLLFFNSPDCPDCERAMQHIEASPLFARWQAEGLTILAVYRDDDLDLWRKAVYPQEWINGYDAGQVITGKRLYDLKAIPTLYLLDRDKRVILKDAPIEQIERWAVNEWAKRDSATAKPADVDERPR